MKTDGCQKQRSRSFAALYYLGWMFLSFVAIAFIPAHRLGFFGPAVMRFRLSGNNPVHRHVHLRSFVAELRAAVA